VIRAFCRQSLFRAALILAFIFAAIAGVVIRPTFVSKEAATVRMEIVSLSGAAVVSIFEGLAGPRLTQEELRVLLDRAKAVRNVCRSEDWGVLEGLTAWLRPPAVLACPIPICSGHGFRTYEADCAGCGIRLCEDGGLWESGCEAADYSCCCGAKVCSHS